MSTFKKIFAKIGQIGTTLMFPIAVLPVAAILLRIGADIPTDTAFSNLMQQIITQAGGVIFDNLYLLFAVGLAFGFTKERRGEAAFAGLVAMFIVAALVPILSGVIYQDVNFGAIKEISKTGYQDKETKEILEKIDPRFINDYTEIPLPVKGFKELFGGKYNAVLGGNILTAIIVGAFVAWIYNKFNDVELPKVLGFFSGRRLIPAMAIVFAVIFSFAYSIIFPWVAYVIWQLSISLSRATQPGAEMTAGVRFTRASIMGVYGFLNRLLIPFGLHHITNNIFWFQLGEFTTENGETINGDIHIFLSGKAKDNPGGLFQAGFFPMMMFGLPALVGAFVFTAENKEQKRRVIALFGSAALVSFISGITEPIEFAFLYASPFLYLIHAILTGIFAFITGVFGIQLGFGFSAGFMDFAISITKSLAIIKETGFTGITKVMANPFWIIPIGLLTGAAYFFIGTFLIKQLNLNTPGRGEGKIKEDTTTHENKEIISQSKDVMSPKAQKIVKAFGGWDNIVDYANCATRLRYKVKDGSKVNQEALKSAGAFGVIKISDNLFHAIFGVEAEILNNEIVKNINKEI
ncbi:PTS transporter subunit EIIC [Mesomycoplasma neurolyticum]|uniref:Phosphotransferase permease, EIIB domain-containing protein n=1 Tax=Mesomycoplasma neurolyticum TaxID=2120 RepID=A0A449A6H7_9BACT|nr:PTS transporter subunit EIIC [Mesomycoplasma neurolyticum]VEU59838.1 phosphotransferase permease, EIIB domain-containing protein [Mesomycoplasma neurolyticum]